MKHLYIIVLLLALFPAAGIAQTPSLNVHGLDAPTFFIQNQGQIKDQNGQARGDIDFVLSAKGMNIFIGAGTIHYQFAKPGETHAGTDTDRALVSDASAATGKKPYELYRLDMVLNGADLHVVPLMEDMAESRINYYNSDVHITHVPVCRKITYKNIYPGIDWVLYLQQGKLKYDFVLQNGVAADKVDIRYYGATAQTLTAEGRLNIVTPLGFITEDAPIAWTATDHKPVAAAFKPAENGWAFALEPWTGALVLDPGLAWSTYYGGNNQESAQGICTFNDNVYITGSTISLSQIATSGAYQTSFYGGIDGDAYLARFAGDGTLIWATYYGGDMNDIGWNLATDVSGNVYMTGYTESAVGIATVGGHQPLFGAGNADAFLAKFSSSGQRVWATYYGGGGPDYGRGIAINGNDLYLAGTSYSTTNIGTAGTYQPSYLTNGPSQGNGFLSKWDLNGNLAWGTYYGAGTTEASDVAVEQNHGIYIAGVTSSGTAISTGGSHQGGIGGLKDDYLAKFNSAGQRLWATYYGGVANEGALPALLANEGKIYLAGITYSATGMATAGSSRQLFSNTIDGYLAAFTPNGVREWGTYIGPGSLASGLMVADITAGRCDEVYVVGQVYPSNGLVTSSDAYQSDAGGGTLDGGLLRYDAQGNCRYSSLIGGAREDVLTGVAMSKDGNLYLTGTTQSDSSLVTDSSYQATYGGLRDAFVMRFLDVFPGDKESPDVILDSVQCINDTFFVPYTVSAAFFAGNVFQAELSDASGSFANPLIIGTTTVATGNGFIPCYVPQSVAPGGGYRLRLSGSAPAAKSSCTLPLYLNLPPIPDITIQGDTLTASATTGGYQWIRNGQNISGATNQRIKATVAGWYKVKVTDPLTGCSAYSDSVAVGNVGIGDISDLHALINIYPNPTSDKIQVQLAPGMTNLQAYTLSVNTVVGNRLYTRNGLQHQNTIDLRALADGVYFVVIKGPEGQAVFRVAKH